MADRSQPGAPGGHGRPSAPPPGRYGPNLSAAQRRRRTVLVALVAGAVGLVLVVWVGAGIARTPVQTQQAGFSVVDDSTIDVTFYVSKRPDAVAECRVQALNPSFAEVGVKDIVVGASETRQVRVTARLATSERATTGIVESCRILQD